MTYIFSPLYSLKLSLTKLPRLALKRLQIGMMYSDSKRISKKRTSEVEVFSLFHLSNRSDHGVLSFSFPRSSPEVWGVRVAQLEFCGSQSRERISSQVCHDNWLYELLVSGGEAAVYKSLSWAQWGRLIFFEWHHVEDHPAGSLKVPVHSECTREGG